MRNPEIRLPQYTESVTFIEYLHIYFQRTIGSDDDRKTRYADTYATPSFQYSPFQGLLQVGGKYSGNVDII